MEAVLDCPTGLVTSLLGFILSCKNASRASRHPTDWVSRLWLYTEEASWI